MISRAVHFYHLSFLWNRQWSEFTNIPLKLFVIWKCTKDNPVLLRMLQICNILLSLIIPHLFIATTYLIKSSSDFQCVSRQSDTPLHIILHHVHSNTIPTILLIRKIKNQYIISLKVSPSGHSMNNNVFII